MKTVGYILAVVLSGLGLVAIAYLTAEPDRGQACGTYPVQFEMRCQNSRAETEGYE